MVEQKVRRRREFQAGSWVRMGDGQRWMFPDPPSLGTDREYDALIRCLLEAEDKEEARRIELALGILLLSRNYDPQPSEYEAAFNFGAYKATRSAAQAAIPELIYDDLEKRCIECVPRQSPITSIRAGFGTLRHCSTPARAIPLADRSLRSPRQPKATLLFANAPPAHLVVQEVAKTPRVDFDTGRDIVDDQPDDDHSIGINQPPLAVDLGGAEKAGGGISDYLRAPEVAARTQRTARGRTTRCAGCCQPPTAQERG